MLENWTSSPGEKKFKRDQRGIDNLTYFNFEKLSWMEWSFVCLAQHHLTFLQGPLQHFEAVALDVVSITGQGPVLGGLTGAVRETAWIYQQTEKAKSRTETLNVALQKSEL